MLTINTRMTPVFDTKFKPVNQNNINFQTLNAQASNNLSGMPEKDVFVKKNNISFTGVNSMVIIGRCDPPEYNNEYKKALEEKFDNLWKWAQKQEKYDPYFKNMNIEKPKIHITESQNNKIHILNSEPCEAAKYLWIDNSICLNRSFAPNMLLVYRGEITLVSQVKAFLCAAMENIKNYDKALEILCGNKLDATVENSKKCDELFYRKLNPQEAAEVAVPYLAHELDHLIMAHILFNTSGMKTSYYSKDKQSGNFAFEAPFYKLKDDNLFPEGINRSWEESYPYKYIAKNSGQPVYNKDDLWELNAKDGFKRRLRLENVFSLLFAHPKEHKTNYLDLNGQCAALEYLEQYSPKKFGDEDIDNMMDTIMEYQKRFLKDDIQERERAIRQMEEKPQKKKKKNS